MRACTCDTGGNPASYEGPDRECPQHGDINARYGLNRGPGLLGLSYRAMAKRVAAVRDLAVREERDDRALHLVSDALAAVSSQSTEELRLHLEIVAARVAEWRADLFPVVHIYDDGAGGVWEHPGGILDCKAPECRKICVDPRCPAGYAHYGPCPGPHSVDGIRSHLPSTERGDEQRRQFTEAFPGYCSDGTCGVCGACELRKDDGS